LYQISGPSVPTTQTPEKALPALPTVEYPVSQNQSSLSTLSQRASSSAIASQTPSYLISTARNYLPSPPTKVPATPPSRERVPKPTEAASYVTKRYKPVARKVRPILGALPNEFRITRNITGDPLAELPKLSPSPPSFVPTGRYTRQRKEALDKAHPDFLWPEERRLMHHFMMLHEQAFAWEVSERGRFKPEFFPPVEIPVVTHEPWVQKNIPIPPGIYDEVCEIIRTKIDAGVYEPSNSSYRSRWFCVDKTFTSDTMSVFYPRTHETSPPFRRPSAQCV
jgi:hypothetical protein